MEARHLVLCLALTALTWSLFSAVPIAAERTIMSLDGRTYDLARSISTPNQMHYQGYLVEATDSSAVTATLEMTFRLFTTETKGAELWSETHPAVEVRNGLFQVLLGSVTTFPMNLFAASSLWLQTEVGTEILMPRKPLVSVAYSRRADDAAMLVGHSLANLDNRWINEDQANSVTSAMIVDGDIADGDIAAGADIAPVKIAGTAWTADSDGAGSGLDADLLDGQQGADFIGMDDLDHLDAADGIPGNAVYVDDTGRVGIGTTNPVHLLDIDGSVNATTYYGDGSNLTGISGTTDNDWTISGDDIYRAAGNVGIGTTNPAARLDIQGALNVGQDSSGYDVTFYGGGGSFSGAKLFWDEDKMALRAGIDTDGIYWEPDSIGNYSLAVGFDTKASGAASIAMGRKTIASGIVSTAMGLYTTASGERSTAMGRETTASGSVSTAMGYRTTASGNASTAMGQETTALGGISTAMGWETIALGEVSTAMGFNTIASGNMATAMGYGTTASGHYSTAIGMYVTAGANAAIVLGRGVSDSAPLVNNIDSSLAIGFNDTTATLFVGTDHRVGVGLTDPAVTLDVSDMIRIQGRNYPDYPDSGAGLEIAYWPPGNTGIIQAYSRETSSFGNLYLGNGNVGIGTESPTQKLHVMGDIYCTGKLTSDGGNDPPYVLYNKESRAAIVDRVAAEVPEEKQDGAVLFWNGEDKRFEVYLPDDGEFRDLDGNLLDTVKQI